jgi:hypothetical protein
MLYLITFSAICTDLETYVFSEEIEAKSFAQAESKFNQMPKHKDNEDGFDKHEIIKIEKIS